MDYVYDDLTPGANTFKFGAGVNQANIKLRLGSPMLDLNSGGDQVHIEGFNPNDVFNSVSISSFEFADGSVLSSTELLARGFDLDGTNLADTVIGTNTMGRIYGLDGDDILVGGLGNDTEAFYGAANSDWLEANELILRKAA